METRNAPGYTSKQQIKKNADRAVGRALDVVPATQITSNHANAMETPPSPKIFRNIVTRPGSRPDSNAGEDTMDHEFPIIHASTTPARTTAVQRKYIAPRWVTWRRVDHSMSAIVRHPTLSMGMKVHPKNVNAAQRGPHFSSRHCFNKVGARSMTAVKRAIQTHRHA
jgi:hypothetical protein